MTVRPVQLIVLEARLALGVVGAVERSSTSTSREGRGATIHGGSAATASSA